MEKNKKDEIIKSNFEDYPNLSTKELLNKRYKLRIQQNAIYNIIKKREILLTK
jgi:Mor family transcriptional regulator